MYLNHFGKQQSLRMFSNLLAVFLVEIQSEIKVIYFHCCNVKQGYFHHCIYFDWS